MQVNLRQDVYDRGRELMDYGDSWSDLVERLMDYYEQHMKVGGRGEGTENYK